MSLFLMYATKQRACQQIEKILDAPFDEGVFQAKNLMLFESAMSEDPKSGYFALLQMAKTYGRMMDYSKEESLEESVRRVNTKVVEDVLSGEVSLGRESNAGMDAAKVLFDGKMTQRRNDLRSEGELLPGMPEHMEARITVAIMMAEALAGESKSYEKRTPEMVDRIKASIPGVVNGSQDLTLGSMMFDNPNDIKDMVSDSHYIVRAGMYASQLQYGDLEQSVKSARAEQAIRRDMDSDGPSR